MMKEKEEGGREEEKGRGDRESHPATGHALRKVDGWVVDSKETSSTTSATLWNSGRFCFC